MVMARYSDLYEHMVTEVPGCPEPLMAQHLYEAGRAFMESSRVWEETLPPIDLVASEREYDLAPRWQAEVEVIRQVRVNTAAGVTTGRQGAVVHPHDYWMERSDTGMFAQLVFAESAEPSVSVTNGLVVQVTLVPSEGKHTLPVWLLQRYYRGIISSACSELMTRDERSEYFNPVRAEWHAKRYRRDLIKAKGDRIRRGRKRPRNLLDDKDESE